MRCGYCAEEVLSLSSPCLYCGEVTQPKTLSARVAEMATSLQAQVRARQSALRADRQNALRQETPRSHRPPSQELFRNLRAVLPAALFVAMGLVLVVTPFAPGLSLAISPVYSSEPWTRTVSAKYLESVLPIALPLLGAVIVVSGTRSPSTRLAPFRSAIVLFAAAATGALGAWSAVSLYRLGAEVTDRFSEVMLSNTVRAEFQVLGPVIPVAVSVAVAIGVAIKARWRAAAAGTMIVALAAGTGAGALTRPLQSPEPLIERASVAAESGLRDAEALALAGRADTDASCDGVNGEHGCYDRAWCVAWWTDGLEIAITDVVEGFRGALVIGLRRHAQLDYSAPVASQILQAIEAVTQAAYYGDGYAEASRQAARLCSGNTTLRETQETQMAFDRETG